MVEQKKRRRRTPEEARQEILDASEEIILTSGPVELKFQTIAERAGLAKSNVHHHFGGVLEIKKALTERLLERLTVNLVQALSEPPGEDLIAYAESVLARIYDVLAAPSNARLIGWVALSTEIESHADFVQPIPYIVQVVKAQLAQFVPAELAQELAEEVVYQISITSLGEGMIGDALAPVLPGRRGVDWLREFWKLKLADALGASASS